MASLRVAVCASVTFAALTAPGMRAVGQTVGPNVNLSAAAGNGQPIPDAMAKALDGSAKARLDATSAKWVDYSPSKDEFDAKIKTSSKLPAGAHLLEISVVQGTLVLARGSRTMVLN